MAVSEEESSSAKSRSGSNGVHYLAKCVLRGSVVLQVVQGHIRSPSSNDVVFGKETSIELVIIDDDGIAQSICEQPVFGTIKDLIILPWNEKFHARSPQPNENSHLLYLQCGVVSNCDDNEHHRRLEESSPMVLFTTGFEWRGRWIVDGGGSRCPHGITVFTELVLHGFDCNGSVAGFELVEGLGLRWQIWLNVKLL
ncbi:hypothetical protein TEA_006488 [Camellia sinensis var. sinensis]|uniref:RSE1/DDB1/CPSF1 first beta-propeller domain-containing protein n=1 Tax=Camellia sinensis var. sinensis TaxID=542762 RepID=A0A4S4EX77_CAMSN|nr:hypothetical protein TEA_006488 [Camellia sinensis var. sinensis]